MPTNTASSKTLSSLYIAGIVALFFLIRVLILSFIHPYYYTLGGGEEPYIAMVGLELLTGPLFPIFDYLISDYQGGTLVVASIAAPLFKLFGPSTFISKLPALILFGASLGLWIQILKKYFTPSILFYFVLLFIFSNPSFTQFSHTVLGYHSESIFFTTLALFIFYKITEDKLNAPLLYSFFGFVCGFGLWFAYIFAFTLLSILIAWFIHDKKFIFKRSFLLFTAFFLIGFSPWLLFNIPNNFSGTHVYGEPLLAHFKLEYFLSAFEHYRNTAIYHLALSFAPPFWAFPVNITKQVAINYLLLYGFPILFWLVVVIKESKSVEMFKRYAFYIIYCVLFLIAIQFSDFDGERYFIPMHLSIFLFCSSGLALLESISKREKLFKCFFTSFLLLIFIISHLPILSAKYTGRIFQTKGYAYQWIDFNICADYESCLSKYESIKQKLSSEDLHEFSSELAAHTAWSILEKNPIEKVIERGKTIPISFQKYYYYFLGRELVERYGSIDQSIKLLSALKTNPHYNWALKGVYDKAVGYEKSSEPRIDSNQKNEAYWRYIGKRILNEIINTKHADQKLWQRASAHLSTIDVNYHPFFIQGVGQAYYDLWTGNVLEPNYNPKFIESFPQGYLKSILEGIGIEMANREFLWRVVDKNWYVEEFSANLSANSKKIILESRKNFQESFYG